jgi:hypothetical protein
VWARVPGEVTEEARVRLAQRLRCQPLTDPVVRGNVLVVRGAGVAMVARRVALVRQHQQPVAVRAREHERRASHNEKKGNEMQPIRNKTAVLAER